MKRLLLASVLCSPFVALRADDDFVRGDANGDLDVTVSDPVVVLSFLLAGGPDPWHFDAADVNDDGFITPEDPIWAFRHVFSMGLVGPIPDPYPLPGQDPTADTISQGGVLLPPEPPPDPDFILSLEREYGGAVAAGGEVSFLLQIRYRGPYPSSASQAYAALQYDPEALELREAVSLLGEGWECTAVPAGEGEVGTMILQSQVTVEPPQLPAGPFARLTFVTKVDVERPEVELVYAVGRTNHYFYTGVGYHGPDESVPTAPQPTILKFAIATRVSEGTFLRGDANGDFAVDVGDATTIQSYLAGNQVPVASYDAFDAGDDGFLTFEDSIWLLRFLFGVGNPPLPPHPEPGLDPTPDTIQATRVSPPPEPPPDGRYKVWLHWVTSPEIVAGDTVRLRLKVIHEELPGAAPTQAHAAVRFTESGLRLENVEPLLGEGWEVLVVELRDETVDPPQPTGQLGVVLFCRECAQGTPRPIPSGEDAVEITFTAIPSMLPVVPQVELAYTVGRGNLHFYTGVGIFASPPGSPVAAPPDPLFRVSFRETGSRFIRGDANGFEEPEISVDISDPVYILTYLYLGVSPDPRCLDALDADDTGEIELTDAVYLLDYLFLGGSKPPLPFGETPADCDVDPTSYDDLGCEFYRPSYAK